MNWQDEWTPQGASADFASRVVEQALAEGRRKRETRRVRFWGVATALGLAAAAVFFVWRGPTNLGERGEVMADIRREVAVGSHAVAVLEPGATIRWVDRSVQQRVGDVFYRVNPGGSFEVGTPAGLVRVTGTCFRIVVDEEKDPMGAQKSAAWAGVGIVVGASAVVTVYEGRVIASTQEGTGTALVSGESARLNGVVVERVAGDSERAEVVGKKEDPSLGKTPDAIAELKSRLARLSEQKEALESKLALAEQKAENSSGGVDSSGRHPFDLTQEDWGKLAEEKTFKFRLPCLREPAWTPNEEQVRSLGISPEEVSVLKAAYARSKDRVIQLVEPICAKYAGSLEAARSLGIDTCIHLVVNAEQREDGALERQGAEFFAIRSGRKPLPPTDAMTPFVRLMLGLTGELGLFEKDLAEHFGPDDAHELAFSKALCAQHSTWGGRTSRPE